MQYIQSLLRGIYGGDFTNIWYETFQGEFTDIWF